MVDRNCTREKGGQREVGGGEINAAERVAADFPAIEVISICGSTQHRIKYIPSDPHITKEQTRQETQRWLAGYLIHLHSRESHGSHTNASSPWSVISELLPRQVAGFFVVAGP